MVPRYEAYNLVVHDLPTGQHSRQPEYRELARC